MDIEAVELGGNMSTKQESKKVNGDVGNHNGLSHDAFAEAMDFFRPQQIELKDLAETAKTCVQSPITTGTASSSSDETNRPKTRNGNFRIRNVRNSNRQQGQPIQKALSFAENSAPKSAGNPGFTLPINIDQEVLSSEMFDTKIDPDDHNLI